MTARRNPTGRASLPPTGYRRPVLVDPGAFLRVDTPEASGLGGWLAAQGLAPVGGGIAMVRSGAPAAAPEFQTFALAAQALG